GPGVVNAETGERVLLGKSKTFDDIRAMSEALAKDQLVDFVLAFDVYTNDSYVKAAWVANNINNWGGVRNRRPGTKRLYVVKLLHAAYDPFYVGHVLTILESIGARDEWDAMIGQITGDPAVTLQTLREGMGRLLGNPAQAARIRALERRWGAVLTDRPGAR